MFKMSTIGTNTSTQVNCVISQRLVQASLHTCTRRCRSSSTSWTWQWRHICVTCEI